MVNTILSNPIISEMVLPFILVFTIVFAVLQKSEILGKGKRQIDALVALSIGLIVVTVGNVAGIMNNLVIFLAIGLVVILVFLMLIGMLYKEGTFEVHKGIKITIGIVSAIAVVIAVLYSTGGWAYISDLFSGELSPIITNIIFLAIIAGAAILAILGGKSGGEKSK